MKTAAQGYLLVVDDNEMNRDLLSRRLRREGYKVDLADDGYKALEMIQATKYDLVLLDIMMPGLSGLELLPMIRETYSLAELPIVMATSKDQSDDIVEGLQRGANDYVTKPIDLPVLLARLNIHLQLKHLAQLKDEFLRIASHDLKNPLSTVLMAAQIVRDRVPPGAVMEEQFYQMLYFIVKHSENMQRIIYDFLDFQAVEDGRVNLVLLPTFLNKVVFDVIESQMTYAQRKQIALTGDLANTLPKVRADQSRISQVLQNLIGNALKFCPPHAEVVVRTLTSDKMVLVEVCDNGPGLTADDLKNVFTKYARLSNQPTGEEKSSGLGLAICKQMIELHGGQIGVYNNADRGATFWFSLPAMSNQTAMLVEP